LSNAIKILLETRHLYQKVSVPSEEALALAFAKVASHNPSTQHLATRLREAGIEPIHCILPADRTRTNAARQGLGWVGLALKLENIKILCPDCGQREAFGPIWMTDANHEKTVYSVGGAITASPEFAFQLFTFMFQCLVCKKSFTSFLVRLEGWSLTLEGRSPFEELEIARFIPKRESKYFRDAVIAFNAGKTLAAIFYLRVFLEQFGRRKTQLTGRETGETIMNAYAETLPVRLRDEMPSLGLAYSDLSQAVHAAEENAELFVKVRENIERHFDIRRVHRIPN
jgi:hypothetical protein